MNYIQFAVVMLGSLALAALLIKYYGPTVDSPRDSSPAEKESQNPAMLGLAQQIESDMYDGTPKLPNKEYLEMLDSLHEDTVRSTAGALADSGMYSYTVTKVYEPKKKVKKKASKKKSSKKKSKK